MYSIVHITVSNGRTTITSSQGTCLINISTQLPGSERARVTRRCEPWSGLVIQTLRRQTTSHGAADIKRRSAALSASPVRMLCAQPACARNLPENYDHSTCPRPCQRCPKLGCVITRFTSAETSPGEGIVPCWLGSSALSTWKKFRDKSIHPGHLLSGRLEASVS